MKKLLQVILTCAMVISFAQNKEIIKLKGNIPNNGETEYKSLIVVDQRENKTIGVLPFGDHEEMREVAFEASPNEDLGKWYRKSNLKGGKQELVLVLKKLSMSVREAPHQKKVGTLNFSVQSFAKEGDHYQFLYKKDTVFAFNHKDVSDVMVKNMYLIFSAFLNRTYGKKPNSEVLTINEVSDYERHIKKTYGIFTSETLKEGIYLDHISFFKQIPEEGNFVLEKNEHGGGVVKAISENNGKKKKISASKMFAYVENGKAYKNVSQRFLELNRNEKGFYLLAKPKDIFSNGVNFSTGAMFGLIGVLVETAIAVTPATDSNIVQEIYIDPLTGEYDFSDENLNKLIQ